MIRGKLISKSACPYGGMFVLNCPEKGFVGKATNFRQLLDSIREWRRANAFPIGLGFEDEVEQEIVLHYPQEAKETDPRVPDSSMRITLDDVMQGTQHVAGWAAAGFPAVTQEEADRRAAICSTCPFSADYTRPCTSCETLKTLVQSIVGGRKTKHDDRLRACRVCKCACAAIVHIPLEHQTKHLSQSQLDSYDLARSIHNCWKSV